MQNKQRRLFLKTAVAGSTVGVAIAAGLLTPATVLAEWNEAAFTAKKVPDAVKGLFGDGAMTDSDKIEINAPDVAENGAVVPVDIKTSLPNVSNISLMVSENASPLTASFDTTDAIKGGVSLRVKVGKSGDLIVAVKSDGKLYTAKRAVKVTMGGCG